MSGNTLVDDLVVGRLCHLVRRLTSACRRRDCAAMTLMAIGSHVESSGKGPWLSRRVARKGAASPAARLMRDPLYVIAFNNFPRNEYGTKTCNRGKDRIH